MTHDEFWELYDGGIIQVKVWAGIVDGEEKTIEAFEHGGKFFLRIHTKYEYTTGQRAWSKRYRMARGNDFIKEFDSSAQANAYFKKAAQGLKRVM